MKTYSPLRRWLREERAREHAAAMVDGSYTPVPELFDGSSITEMLIDVLHPRTAGVPADVAELRQRHGLPVLIDSHVAKRGLDILLDHFWPRAADVAPIYPEPPLWTGGFTVTASEITRDEEQREVMRAAGIELPPHQDETAGDEMVYATAGSASAAESAAERERRITENLDAYLDRIGVCPRPRP